MSKELEAFERLIKDPTILFIGSRMNGKTEMCRKAFEQRQKDIKCIKTALKRLKKLEKPKKRISKTKDQLLVENECYQYMLHTVRYYVESKEFSLEDLAKRIKALEIIKNKRVDVERFTESLTLEDYNKYFFKIGELTKEEFELLKEMLK